MICPFCRHEETKVLDKRDGADEAVTRRRRSCIKCGQRFTTYERFENTELSVVKKDGRREPFSSDKLRRGVLLAVKKRPVTESQITQLVEEVEIALRSKGVRFVKSDDIGAIVCERLKEVDPVAYIRFASVYQSFEDIDEFNDEIRELRHSADESDSRP